MINLFYKYRFTKEYELHEYLDLEITNIKGHEINKKLVVFIDVDSYRAYCGLVLKSEEIALIKIVSNIFEMNEDEYESINKITESGHLELYDDYHGKEYNLVIKDIIDYLEICQAVENTKILFRGQANAEWDLEPSIFRKGVDLSKEREMYRDILQWNIETFSSGDFLKNTCNMQHYGIPTRLMDWTSNPLHALYFACVGADEDGSNGSVLSVQVDAIHDIDSEECKKINTFLEYRYSGMELGVDSVSKEKALKEILTEFSYNKKKYLFFKTKYFNDRIKNQQGYFSIYIDISEDEVQDIKQKILRDVLENIIKELNSNQILIRKEDEERIRSKSLLGYKKYKNLSDIKESIIDTIKVLTINLDYDQLDTLIENQIIKSQLKEVKSKQHRMQEILRYQKHLKIIIPKEVKKEVTAALDRVGINSRVIYPDVEGLSRYMKEKYH